MSGGCSPQGSTGGGEEATGDVSQAGDRAVVIVRLHSSSSALNKRKKDSGHCKSGDCKILRLEAQGFGCHGSSSFVQLSVKLSALGD